MKKISYYILTVVLVGCITSCSTSKKTSKMPMVGGLSGVEYVEKIITAAPDWKNFYGKASLELLLDKQRTKVNASLRIHREEAIQLSIAPLLGIEVARVELTPQGLLFVDRMNKRFVRASFTEVSDLLHVDVNFHILQSLFLNELFLPGKKYLKSEDVGSFMLTHDGNQAKLQPKKMRRIQYQFYTSTQNGSLQKTVVELKGTAYALDWDYSDFTDLDGRLFPRKTMVSLKGAPKTYGLNMKLSRLSVDGKWGGLTRLSDKYQEISLLEILNVLLKL